MRSETEVTTTPTGEFHDFVVTGGCVVCQGPMTVRTTPGTMRGYCARCGWLSRPLVWQQDGKVAVVYPPLASA